MTAPLGGRGLLPSAPRYYLKEVDIQDPRYLELILSLNETCLDERLPTRYRDGWWWILYCRGAAVGYAGLIRSAQYADVGYLCRSGVLPLHRGRGLQTRLIAARERKARSLGFGWTVTDTTDNPASGNNLIRCGYRLYNPVQPWAFRHSVYWKKQL